MQLTKLQLKNFRCFEELNIDFNSPLILIEGENGSGKTSILEALSYICFLRSFRTHITKELINEKFNNFFVKLEFQNIDNNEIQVGFSNKKRLVRINGKVIQSYKDILTHYRVITLTEDDLSLIQGSPDGRRTFLDQHIMLSDSQFLNIFRKYRQILDNRNALLQKGACKYEDYLLWTKSLWQQGKIIQKKRIDTLDIINFEVNNLVIHNFPEINIKCSYEPKYNLQYEAFDDFLSKNSKLYENELIYKRSIFGTHLDDFSISFLEKKTKSFASRGQQKLVTLLIKVAQISILFKMGYDKSIIFLLDDFMTDFDLKRLQSLVALLCSFKVQLIFTSPSYENPLKNMLIAKNAHLLQI